MPTQEKNALNGSNPGQTTLETLTIKGFTNQDDVAVNEATTGFSPARFLFQIQN